MSDDSRTTPGRVGEFAALHPCIFECRNAIDRVEQPQKSDGSDRATESFSECAHEL